MYNYHMQKKTKIKRRPKRFVTKIVSIVVMLIAIYMFIGVGQEVYTTLQLQNQAREVEIQLNNLKEENATLIQQRDKLEDPSYVETYARGEYMFSKDDEKIFYLPSSSDTPSTTDSAE